MRFAALEIALQLVAAIRPIAEATMPRDKDLAGQMRRAANSAALNTAEGGRRVSGDRNHTFTIASGEAAEALAAARIAIADGYAAASLMPPVVTAEDRLQAVLYRLRRPRR
jgi:four helix bundle protein